MLIPVMTVLIALGPFWTRALPWHPYYAFESGYGRLDDDDEDDFRRVRNLLSHDESNDGKDSLDRRLNRIPEIRAPEIGWEDYLGRPLFPENEDLNEEKDPNYLEGGRMDDKDDGMAEIGSGRRDENDEEDDESPRPSLRFPSFNFGRLTRYFKEFQEQLDNSMERMFREVLAVTLLKGTFANTTEEDVDIDGRKFHIRKSIVRDEGKNGSLLVEVISSAETFPNRTKRSNNDAEPNQ